MRWVLCGAFLAAALGCTPARMALAPGLEREAALEVTGRNTFKFGEEFAFGPWSVVEVHRGWKTSSAWSLFGLGADSVEQPYEFVVAKGGARLQAQATTNARRKELSVMLVGLPMDLAVEDQASLAVSWAPAGSANKEQAIRLYVRGPTRGPLHGLLDLPGAAQVEVRGTNALQGSPFPLGETSGYTFERQGQVVGFVEVINSGRVWLSPALTAAEREALAVAAAALLLYQGAQLPEGR